MRAMAHRLVIVDVFAARRYAGNPLAVVIDEAAGLDEATMQQVAAEMNFSETTFVTPTPLADGSRRVRIYTPAREIAFAGHPILGTAWVVRHHTAAPVDAPVRLALQVGTVAVHFEAAADAREVAWFTAPPRVLGRHIEAAAIARALGLSADDIDRTFGPVQQVSSGTSATIVLRCATCGRCSARASTSRRSPRSPRTGCRRWSTCAAVRRANPGTT